MIKINRYTVILSLFFLISFELFGQGIKYMGLVQDEQSKKALAFVNLVSSDGLFGTTTDIDGRFSLVLPSRIDSIRFSYLGYETRYVSTRDLKGPKTIFLRPIKYDLAEYEVFPGLNPAHRIILNTINNREINNPKKLASFSYTTYEKMLVTVDTSAFDADSTYIPSDSVKSVKEFVKTKDIFIMETAVEKKFRAPDRSNERVIASRVSGLKDPMIFYLVSQMQSTSFYDEIIQIMGKSYINPISKGSLKKYYFHIEDTLYSGSSDTIFTVSYRPKRNATFDGMQGTLSISTNKWAIVNVKAEPAKENQGITIQIQQKYDLVDGEHWFPVQLNTSISFNGLKVSTGGQQSRLLGIGKTYLKDIKINPDIDKKEFSYVEIEVDPKAGYRNDIQWDDIRNNALSQRELETYKFMDSLGRAVELDKTLKELETALTGKIGLGYVDLFVNRIIGFNSFEGIWFGLGMQTNRQFSEKLAFGGYYAFSLKDRISKIGIKTIVDLYKPKEIKAQVSFLSDNIESGDVNFFQDEGSLFDPLDFQKFFINRMNYTIRKEAGFSGRLLNYVQLYGGINAEETQAVGDYYFQQSPDNVPVRDFNSAEVRFRLRFAYKEKYINNGRMLISLGTKYPVFWFNYTQGFSGILDQSFDFKKMDLQMRKTFYIKYLGITNISLKAGLLLGDVPYAKLYSGGGTYRPFALCAPGSFGTMRGNEFLSDRYVSLFITHNFDALLFNGGWFNPEIEIATNIGFGWLNNPEYHHNVDFKTMEKGYFESGLMLNKLVRLKLLSVGLGGMYRYGPYSYASFKDNVAYKFTLTLPI